jgi:uncharacterized SAM-binding protein YcdF (DUF218 family)
MSLRRRLLAGLLLLALVLALLWAARVPVLRAAAGWLDVGIRSQKADFVMVLTGEENARPFAAVSLLKAGFARGALVTEIAATPSVIDMIVPPAHEINRQVLLRGGVVASAITILPASATTTYDEAKALAAFLRDRPQIRVLVVTSDCHTRRSRWVFSRALAGQSHQVSFVSAPNDSYRSDYWWQDEAGFVTITAEYLKLAFYVVRYGHLGYWLLACAGLMLVMHRIRRRESLSPGH